MAKSITYPVRFPSDIYDSLMSDCKAEKRSLSALMNKLAEEYLKSIGKFPPPKE
ncbi:hypothetical protein FVR03_01180 [Pontibacter qinzhouensis]|uniref:CopG-like ribbon-helix-helix domain-containing protein n=1 Tax=Pontibacter qinzhouensis TaxID=2603253 RepID=A0A5C8KE58_9BACT|nr:hypothetical protein FVR03_01180 [Pontibacter qinzhouensis]